MMRRRKELEEQLERLCVSTAVTCRDAGKAMEQRLL
jgi:hypothetical protein